MTRQRVVALVRQLRRTRTWQGVATRLGLAASTLQRWSLRWRRGRDPAHQRGRPPVPLPEETRQELDDHLRITSPVVSVAVLRETFPDVTYRSLRDHRARYREELLRNHEVPAWRLDWRRPGAVWGLDFFAFPNHLDDGSTHALTVCDLASPYLLDVYPTTNENCAATVQCLEALFDVWGPPLVAKSDSGSAFIAEDFDSFLKAHGVQHLRSPARTPWFNGAAERCIGWLREHVHLLSSLAGREGAYQLDDLVGARINLNNTARSGRTESGLDAWMARVPVSAEERSSFAAALAAARDPLELDKLGPAKRLRLERSTLQSAMVTAGILAIEEIRIPLRTRKSQTVTRRATKVLHDLLDACEGKRDLLLQVVATIVSKVMDGSLPPDPERWYHALQEPDRRAA
jgi:transposase InsO family protein